MLLLLTFLAAGSETGRAALETALESSRPIGYHDPGQARE